MKRILIAVLIMVTTAPVYAFKHLSGAGTISCGSWIDLRKGSDWYSSANWVAGFLAGAWWQGAEMKSVDANAYAAFIDNYCKDNPLKRVVDGAIELAKELEE